MPQTPPPETASPAAPQTPPPVTESWDRIEHWLAAHAPVTRAALQPPAERTAIAAAERAVGRRFPEPLVESLLRHDGTEPYVLCDLLPPFWAPLGVEGIVAAWSLRSRIHGSDSDAEGSDADAEAGAPDEDFGPWWHPAWIPVAMDGCGDYLVIDQRPGPVRGRIGNADHEDGCRFSRDAAWSSLPALLDGVATALETGSALDGCTPVVTEEGELDWDL